MKFIIVLLIFVSYLFGQYNFNLGLSYLLNHSENEEPRISDSKLSYSIPIEFGYQKILGVSRYAQLGLCLNEYYVDEYKNTFNSSGEPIKRRSHYLLEQSIPIHLRLFISEDGITGYGIGPLYSITKQSFEIDFKRIKDHREVIYINSIGFDAIARIGIKLSPQWFGIISIGYSKTIGVYFVASGQDLSDYKYNTTQIRLTIGVGHNK